MNRITFLVLLFFCSIGQLLAQQPLQEAIRSFVQDPSNVHASVGVCVIEVSSGRIIASHQANRSLIPASALKTVTTASALAMLGSTYRFKTVLQHDGDIVGGVLRGNLYLKGHGDPTYASGQMPAATGLEECMQEIADCLHAANIHEIQGQIIGDDAYFSSQTTPDAWQWNDMGNYYGAGVSGLNFHENLYHLYFQQNKRLDATVSVARIEPAIPDIEIVSEVRSAGARTGDNAYIYGAPYSPIRYVRGTIPVGSGTFGIKGAIPDPARTAAFYLRQALRKSGIRTSDGYTSARVLQREGVEMRYDTRATLYTQYSPELHKIINRTNLKSVNLYCEAMLKTMGIAKKGIGSTKAGASVVSEFWKERGLDTKGWYMEDGSGLSRTNAISAFQLAKIMQLTARDKGIFDHFYASLPIGATSGSLKRMFRGTAAAGNIRAKSGTLERVRSYTGYATDSRGMLLAFCIMTNNFSGSGGNMRRKMERLMVEICEN
ncbi:MAG: D-alanyl-D-alanine carboxypeptidase/D-alanyl-D-alanine-endopeptidase [Bacteroidota bacterium]